MDLRVGTSGFSYAEWKGHFYPEDLGSEAMLSFYGSRLRTVEINNTFYRMPRSEVLEKWARSVPEDFRFVLKASRRITHQSRLHDTKDSVDYLWDKASALGTRLGAILFQLPPAMKADLERLQRFLDDLPRGLQAAFEFRHESWNDDRVWAALREHAQALCISDAEDSEDMPELVVTAPFVYVRLRREQYSDAQIRQWLERLQGSRADRAFVFFKHEEAGAAPQLAQRMMALASGDKQTR